KFWHGCEFAVVSGEREHPNQQAQRIVDGVVRDFCSASMSNEGTSGIPVDVVRSTTSKKIIQRSQRKQIWRAVFFVAQALVLLHPVVLREVVAQVGIRQGIRLGLGLLAAFSRPHPFT